MNSVLSLLPNHGWQIPHVTDDGPARHHHVQVADHPIVGAVPEGISKLWIILNGDGINGAADLERALLELHHGGVVDAGALGKNQDWQLVRILNVVLKSEESEKMQVRESEGF